MRRRMLRLSSGCSTIDRAAGRSILKVDCERLNPAGLAELRADLDRFWLSALTAYKAVVEQPEQEIS